LALFFQRVGLDSRASQVHQGCYRLLPRITSYHFWGWVTLSYALFFFLRTYGKCSLCRLRNKYITDVGF
jgi:hypothetical protein